MTTFEKLRDRLADLTAAREARTRAEEAQRRKALGDDELEAVQAQLHDPAVILAHVEAELVACDREIAAIGTEDAPLNQAVAAARAALQTAEQHRERERHRLRHEDRRRDVDRRRGEAQRLRDQAASAEVDAGIAAGNTVEARVVDDGMITVRPLITEVAR